MDTKCPQVFMQLSLSPVKSQIIFYRSTVVKFLIEEEIVWEKDLS